MKYEYFSINHVITGKGIRFTEKITHTCVIMQYQLRSYEILQIVAWITTFDSAFFEEWSLRFVVIFKYILKFLTYAKDVEILKNF